MTNIGINERIKENIGHGNSGIDLSGDIKSPHFDGDGIFGNFIVSMFVGQDDM